MPVVSEAMIDSSFFVVSESAFWIWIQDLL